MMGRLLLLGAAALALAGLSGGQADETGRVTPRDTGSVRGRVDIRAAAAQAEPRPGVAELGMDLLRRGRDDREAVVYFETAPQGAFEGSSAGHATMSQVNETFVPHVLAIRVGTVVDFPNNDIIYHNVFSLSKARRFDLGRYPKGQSRSVRFDEPGIVRVFCEIHSNMNAFILVFAHRFFDRTDEQGRYRIDQVPPGTYTLVAWYEGAVRQTRVVTVPESGADLDVDFEVR